MISEYVDNKIKELMKEIEPDIARLNLTPAQAGEAAMRYMFHIMELGEIKEVKIL